MCWYLRASLRNRANGDRSTSASVSENIRSSENIAAAMLLLFLKNKTFLVIFFNVIHHNLASKCQISASQLSNVKWRQQQQKFKYKNNKKVFLSLRKIVSIYFFRFKRFASILNSQRYLFAFLHRHASPSPRLAKYLKSLFSLWLAVASVDDDDVSRVPVGPHFHNNVRVVRATVK